MIVEKIAVPLTLHAWVCVWVLIVRRWPSAHDKDCVDLLVAVLRANVAVADRRQRRDRPVQRRDVRAEHLESK
jgi:hypothetical protein